MKLTKLMRVAVMAFATIATVAPAAANGDLWWFDHREGRFPISTHKKFVQPTFFPTVITDEKGKKIENCVANVEGEIYSKYSGMGEGTFTKSSSTPKTCANTIHKECTVTVEPLTTVAWTITVEEKEKKVTITNAKLTIKREGTCPETSLPAESTFSGTIIGEFGSYDPETGAQGRVIFNGKQQLSDGTTKIFLDGILGFGTELTALAEPKGFTATSSPAKIDGKQTTSHIFTTRSGRTVTCEEATLSATAKNGDTTISVAPTYSKCTASFVGLNYPATVKVNGCEYLLHVEAVEEEGDYKYTAPTDLKCPAGKEVEVDVFSSHANHTAGTVTCRYNMGETGNQGLEIVQLTNKAIAKPAKPTSWMEAHIDIGGIDSKRTTGGVLICGAELDAMGTFKGTFELTGTTDDEKKEENGITVFPG